MLDKKKGSLIIVVLLSLFTIILLWPQQKIDDTREYSTNTPLQLPIEYNKNIVHKSFLETKNQNHTVQARGIVLPHHLVASDLIAEALQTIDFDDIQRIILIGPDHREAAIHTAVTAQSDWKIGESILYHDSERVNELIRDGLLVSDNDYVFAEHSITALLPYLHYIAPHATVLPIVLRENQSINRLTDIGKRLTPDEHTLIIASIDFAHYLSLEESNQNDLISLDAIAHFDIEKIYGFNSDYLDSSSAMIVLLEAMKNASSTNYEVINHSNSAIILGREHDFTTSYYTIVFRE